MTEAIVGRDVAASRQALADLRHARRHNHRDAVHWVDALYRVYISGLLAVIAVIVGSGLFGDHKIPLDDAKAFATQATPWLGLAFALAAGIGLRSGGRGGPLTLQAATVQHELLAPVDEGFVLREPALKLLRFAGFAGLCTGGVVAAMGVRQLPVNTTALVVGAAVAFGLAGVAAVALAMLLSGRRVGIMAANALAIALLGWSALDVALGTTTSPFTLLGRLALLPFFSFTPLVLVPVVAVAVLVPAALAGIGGTSIDDARRRAGLVAQLRFAVTLQDIRTVVLLRRQLAQETPRSRPWIRLGRGSRLPAVWHRDWQSYLRFPAVRLARMAALAVIAGVALGVTWNGVRPAFLLAALALYLAAYDAVEPLGQEIDHPSRWDGMPQDHGIVLITHLYAAVAVMLGVCALAAATALVWVPVTVVTTEWLLIPLTAIAAVAAAALSTVMGSPDMAKMMAGPGADVAGFILLFRLVFPPAMVAAALAPAFRAGITVDALNTAAYQNVVSYSLILALGVVFYIRFRTPARI